MIISYNAYDGSSPITADSTCKFPSILDTGDKPFREAMDEVWKKALTKNHICGKFKDNYRSKSNFECADCLELDCDNDSDNEAEWVTPGMVFNNPLLKDCALWTSTSRNHMKVKHAGTDKEKSARPRFHVGLPLSRRVVETELKQIKKALLYTDQNEKQVRAETAFFDKGAKDTAHFIFGVPDTDVNATDGEYIDVVMCKKGLLCLNGKTGQYEAVLSDASYNTSSKANNTMVSADMTKQLDMSTTTSNKASGSATKEYHKYSVRELQDMFKCIAKVDKLDYNDWLHMAMALKSESYDFSLFNELSKMIPGYVSEEDCRAKWDSVADKPVEGGITMGSLITLAQQGGYKTWESLNTTDEHAIAPLSNDFPPFPRYLTEASLVALLARYVGQYKQQEDGSYERVGSRLLFLIKDPVKKTGRFVKFFDNGFRDAGYNPVQHLLDLLAQRQRVWMGKHPVENAKRKQKIDSFIDNKEQGANGLWCIETLLKGFPGIAYNEFSMDGKTSVINCDGLLVDLTGKTAPRALQPCDFITKSTLTIPTQNDWNESLSTNWADPSSTPAQFVKGMLSEILVKEDGHTPDLELINYFQLVVGGALLCKNPNKAVYFCSAKSRDKSEEGNGANGKSTLFNAIRNALGDYTVDIDQSILTKTKDSGKKFSFIRLCGARVALLNEAPDGRLDANSLKKLAPSDGEPIVAEEKGIPQTSFTATHTVFVLTNNEQTVREMDSGTWRRIVKIPFNAHFEITAEGNKKAQRLASRECAEALLDFLIQGAHKVSQLNYVVPIPNSVQEATKQYKLEQNEVLTFLEQCDLETCIYPTKGNGEPICEAGTRIVWEATSEYKEQMGLLNLYCDWAGEPRVTKFIRADFLKRLQSCYKPAKLIRSHNVYYICGIRRRPIEAKDISDTHS